MVRKIAGNTEAPPASSGFCLESKTATAIAIPASNPRERRVIGPTGLAFVGVGGVRLQAQPPAAAMERVVVQAMPSREKEA